MKYGFNTTLKVDIPDINVEDVEKIEFIFKRSKASTAKVLKEATYPNDVTYVEGFYMIPWTSEETYSVEAGTKFYMDTRITLKTTMNQPETNICELIMHTSLFEEV